MNKKDAALKVATVLVLLLQSVFSYAGISATDGQASGSIEKRWDIITIDALKIFGELTSPSGSVQAISKETWRENGKTEFGQS